MPNDTDAQVLQVFRRQARKDRLVNLVLAEDRLVLPEAQTPQPTPEVPYGTLNGLLMIVQPSREIRRNAMAGCDR